MDDHERESKAGGPAPDRAWIMHWRKAERQRLLAQRAALTPDERRCISSALATHLDGALGDLAGRTIGLYWPFRGEPNLRHWMARAHERGAVCALPVVVERSAPLVFRVWRPGCAMARGLWDIPVPAQGEVVTPDIVVAPLVGFDAAGYRLGYGGGYYDRTLAVMARQPRVVGVGLAQSALATIHPLPHDRPMDLIVTEAGLQVRTPGTRP